MELQTELRETVETLDYLSDKFTGDHHITAMRGINSARSQKHLIQQLAKQLWKNLYEPDRPDLLFT